MLATNQVNNSTLLAMMRDAEKQQRNRFDRKASMSLSEKFAVQTPSIQQTPKSTAEVSPPKTALAREQVDCACEKTILLTHDEAEWLSTVAVRQGHSSSSGVLSRLVDVANSEPPAAKKHLFLVIRCRRCSAGAKGGVKKDQSIELSTMQWQWLESVRERCKHASVGKTIRIIIDFYMALCVSDAGFEQQCLRAGSVAKTGRHESAVGNVDPTRAPLKAAAADKQSSAPSVVVDEATDGLVAAGVQGA
jgi:hypothetical protein